MKLKLFRPPWLIRIFYLNRVWNIPSPDSVFLTFDDGPTETTDWILTYLKSENILGTFFCVGENVIQHREYYDRILNDGHSVGNHTYKHRKRTLVSETMYQQDVEQAKSCIESNLFRPPYGRLDLKTGKKLRKRGYKIIMWSWLSYDYNSDVSNETILQKANSIKPGDIIVFHDNEKNHDRIKMLLPPIVDALKQKGIKFKPISF